MPACGVWEQRWRCCECLVPGTVRQDLLRPKGEPPPIAHAAASRVVPGSSLHRGLPARPPPVVNSFRVSEPSPRGPREADREFAGMGSRSCGPWTANESPSLGRCVAAQCCAARRRTQGRSRHRTCPEPATVACCRPPQSPPFLNPSHPLQTRLTAGVLVNLPRLHCSRCCCCKTSSQQLLGRDHCSTLLPLV
jgi:hypothetical protein